MSAPTLDKLIWVLLYGGLLAAALGLAVQRREGMLGWSLVVGGGIAAALGIVLIGVRSRVRGDGE